MSEQLMLWARDPFKVVGSGLHACEQRQTSLATRGVTAMLPVCCTNCRQFWQRVDTKDNTNLAITPLVRAIGVSAVNDPMPCNPGLSSNPSGSFKTPTVVRKSQTRLVLLVSHLTRSFASFLVSFPLLFRNSRTMDSLMAR